MKNEIIALFCLIVLLFYLFFIPVRAVGIDPTQYLGDVDSDGNVTAGDARLALRQSVGLEQLSDDALFYADYDANGSVTSADARMILRTSVSLEPLVYPEEREKPTPRIPDDPEPEKLSPEIKNQWFVSFCDAVDYVELSSDMYWLVEEIGIRSWWDNTQNHAANLLYDRLRDIGFTEDRLRMYEFTHGGIIGRNIMAVVSTVAETPEIILIMAHYDTARGTEGAVDNAHPEQLRCCSWQDCLMTRNKTSVRSFAFCLPQGKNRDITAHTHTLIL